MTNQKNITSADAVFLLTITGLFNKAVLIQGFSSDSAFTFEAIAPAEVQMGVDGHLSAGMVHVPMKQKISIQADSDSAEIFDTWYQSQKLDHTIYYAAGTITLNSVQKTYSLARGVLTSYTPIPSAKKTLQALEFEITWESVSWAKV